MLEIECLVCGQTIMLPEYIDLDDYDGQLTCRECNSLHHVILVDSKVRKCEIVEKVHRNSSIDKAIIDIVQEKERTQEAQPVKGADVEKIALYNPLRDYLSTYVASQLRLTFDQIEGMTGEKLETSAYTLKSWWENDSSHPQAIAWIESGWRVLDVNLPQRSVSFLRLQTDKDDNQNSRD